jgi:hypothetical protein
MPMLMPVMQVRIVRVPVYETGMPVPMRMWLAGRIAFSMLVLMVFVVVMPMLVLHQLMDMFVLVPLGQVQPEAGAHQGARDKDLH